MDYKTQMEAARKGIITDAMKHVSKIEDMDIELLMQKMAEGKIIIPFNKNHKNLIPAGVGEGLKTKINVNIGISRDCPNITKEMEKVELSLKYNADSIMDLSCFGDTSPFRKALLKKSTAIIGTVPMYDATGLLNKELKDLTSDDFLDVARTHAEDGVDFLTIHVGLNKKTADRINSNTRLTNLVSRGGTLLYSWMAMTGQENPYYERYEELLEICREYDVTLSLGDGCRPGSLADATDATQIEELITLGELTKRAWKKDVQVMIEGPGHVPINEIKTNVILQKKLCYGAPFYVLGPLVTDIAPGYDHITSAIGGAIAATAGADFLCYVTPAEHLKIPSLDDVKEGIIACQIAAHAGDIGKGVKNADRHDYAISKARANLDWKQMFDLALDPEKPKRYRAESKPELENSCTMCGDMCAIKNMNSIMDGKKVILAR